MRRWNLTKENIFNLTLAADVRAGGTDYSDDHIWELSFGGGEPPAIALSTTFGLRARGLRLFPRFVLGDQEACDPGNFARGPVVRNFYPNFVRLDFSPFPDIDVRAEYWVPQSHAVLGRFWITNQSEIFRNINLEWAAVLTPTEGQRMAADQIEGTPVLCGETGNLSPVVFMTGGARPGKSPYPSLVRELEFNPGEELCTAWSHTALGSHKESFELARQLTALPWEAHAARIEMLNAGLVEIYTGNPDWDLAFAISQYICQSLFVGPTPQLPEPSFVNTRLPDQGYSLRGDGSDYNHLWNGQTPLDAYLLSGFLLSGTPELLLGVLRNFFASQIEEGFIDLKPGLGGQRSRALATPLLATLTWRLHQVINEGRSPENDFLAEAYPLLLQYINTWFTTDHDDDQDGLPEWHHPLQTGIEDHLLFSPWHAWSQGADICTSESPALGAMLFHECHVLEKMAALLGEVEQQATLSMMADRLHAHVDTMWDEDANSYQYQDRDSHLTSVSQLVDERTGPGTMILKQSFPNPVRLLLRIQANGETRPQPRIFIHGDSISGKHRIERIDSDQIRWSLDYGIITGERVYTAIEMVELQDLLPQDVVTLSTVGYSSQDITLMLPLWAGIPSADQAEALRENYLQDASQYWREFGLPICLDVPDGGQVSCDAVHIALNCLIGEGLLGYGYQSEAAELVSRLMAGVIKNLKQDGALRRSFNADSGIGIGERSALGGLAPLGLFLEVLGVRLISPHSVHLTGFNPYPWPVTVKYRGLTVLRQKDKSVVIFPDGQTLEVTDPEPKIICIQK